MQSKCGTSCEGGDKDSPIRFQRVEIGKNRQKTIDDLKKGRQKLSAMHKKRLFKNLYRENFFPSPQTRSQVYAYDVMTIILQIVQTQSPVSFKSLRRCSRELGPVGDLVIWGVFLSARFYRGKGNRGPRQSGTWACRGVGIGFAIGNLGLSGNWVYRGFGYREVLLSGKR